jgi:hypothetical protein
MDWIKLDKLIGLKKFTDCSMPTTEQDRVDVAGVVGYNQAIDDVMNLLDIPYQTSTKDQPYIGRVVAITEQSYNPAYGDTRECECGHPYHRHFDSYEDMEAIGCKYCPCTDFKEKQTEEIMNKQPEIGDKIYVPSSLHVYRGMDDFAGGIATISSIKRSDTLPEDHNNYLMVGIEEREGTMYNYKSLMRDQVALSDRFGDQIAHPDPDDREEFNTSPSADWK